MWEAGSGGDPTVRVANQSSSNKLFKVSLPLPAEGAGWHEVQLGSVQRNQLRPERLAPMMPSECDVTQRGLCCREIIFIPDPSGNPKALARGGGELPG